MAAPDPNLLLQLAQKDNAAGIQSLIDAKADPSFANSVGQTALHVAALWGNLAAAEVLVKAGAEINKPNSFNGATPLHCCATENERGSQEGRNKCVALLVGNGGDVEWRDMRGKRPYSYSQNDQIRAMLNGPPVGEEESEPEDEEEEFEPVPDHEKTPVTLVTGFLGSGKTTLINYILTEKHGKKIAVIENEFGAVDIDSSLVTTNLKEKEDIISMDNGCVCCTVRGDLVRAFHILTERDDKYDAVIIETTGMADPAPVAYTFNTNPDVGELYRIDAIVCLVDAKHIQQHLDEVRPDGVINEAVNQIAMADKVLLNKTDLVTEAEKMAVRKSITSINSIAKILETQKARVDLDELLGIASFSLDNVSHMMEKMEEEQEEHHGHAHTHEHNGKEVECHEAHGHESEHGHGHGHGHGHDAGAGSKRTKEGDGSTPKKPKRSSHLSGVGTVGLKVEGDLDNKAFNMFMMELLQTKANDIYRSKGVVKFAGRIEKWVFHGVHEQFDFAPSEEEWKEDEKKESKIVFIGKNLDPAALEAALLKCKADPGA